MGDKSPELVLHLTYELSRNISLMTRGSLAQRNVRPVQPSAETENINIHRKNKSRHKKYKHNKPWLPVLLMMLTVKLFSLGNCFNQIKCEGDVLSAK